MKILFPALILLISNAFGSVLAAQNESQDRMVVTVTATRTAREVEDTPATVSVIDRETLASYGAPTFEDIADREPLVSAGFDVPGGDPSVPYNSGGDTAYNIRGIGDNRVLLTLDGIRLPEEVDFQVGGIRIDANGRDYFDSALFEAVEIVKGSASSLYGSDAVGGVIAFQTPSAADFLTQTDRPFLLSSRTSFSSASQTLSQVSSYAQRIDRAETLLMYAYKQGQETESETSPVDGEEIFPDPLDAVSHHFLLRSDFTITDEHRLEASLEYFERQRDIDQRSQLDEPFDPSEPPPTSTTTTERVLDSLLANDRFRKRVSLKWQYDPLLPTRWYDTAQTQIYFQDSENRDRLTQGVELRTRFPQPPPPFVGNPDIVVDRVGLTNSDFRQKSYGFTGQVSKEVYGETLYQQITYGWEFIRSDFEKPFSETITETPREGGETTEELDDTPRVAPSDILRLGLFIQDEIAWKNWLILPGVRFDHYRIDPDNTPEILAVLGEPSPDFRQSSFSPRLSIQYSLTETWNLYGSYSRGFRNPTAIELAGAFIHPPGADFRTAPAPDLEAESSHGFELGTKFTHEHFRTSASVFFTEYSNFIDSPRNTGERVNDPVTGRDFSIFRSRNIGEVEVYGFELSGEADLGILHESLNAFTATLATGLSIGENKEENSWLESTDPFQVRSSIKYLSTSERFGATMSVTWVDQKRRISDEFLVPTDSYFVVDLVGRVKVTDHLTLGAGIRNLTDSQYTRWANVQGNVHGDELDRARLFQRASAAGINGFISATLTY